jgi:hypothetical protein
MAKKKLSDNKVVLERRLKEIRDKGILSTFCYMSDLVKTIFAQQQKVLMCFNSYTYEDSALQNHNLYSAEVIEKMDEVFKVLYKEVKEGRLKL